MNLFPQYSFFFEPFKDWGEIYSKFSKNVVNVSAYSSYRFCNLYIYYVTYFLHMYRILMYSQLQLFFKKYLLKTFYFVLHVHVSCSVLSDCNPMDCSPSGSSVHRILQARMLKWVAIPFSRESSWLGDQTWVSFIADRLFALGSHFILG